MAALLVGLGIMAVVMTALTPTWHHMVQRDKEEEMIFRGQQYARAIGLFQRKAGPGVLPPNLDVLVDQRFLRKKYTDPIANDDFDILYANVGNSGTPAPGQTQAAPQAPTAATPGAGRGGIIGVVSKSKETSIRVVNGRTTYNEIQFVYVAQTAAPGGGTGQGGSAIPGVGAPGAGGIGRGTGGGTGQGAGQGRGAGQGQSPFGNPSGNSPFNRGGQGQQPQSPFSPGFGRPPASPPPR